MIVNAVDFSKVRDLTQVLSSRGYSASDWIKDICKSIQIPVLDCDQTMTVLKVSELFNDNSAHTLTEIYQAAEKRGFREVDPAVAIYLRTLYNDQSIGRWMRVATPIGSMVDSDGVPHLPKFGYALGKYYIETYWAYPHATFLAHNEFIFRV